jgi:hypothetical protein
MYLIWMLSLLDRQPTDEHKVLSAFSCSLHLYRMCYGIALANGGMDMALHDKHKYKQDYSILSESLIALHDKHKYKQDYSILSESIKIMIIKRRAREPVIWFQGTRTTCPFST